MNILSAESLGKAFIETPLFEDVSISLALKQKAALIAANGVGKTTLLRILAGKETADSGQVSLRNGTRLGYLEQEPALNENDTIKESLFNSDNPIMNCIGDYEFCLTRGDQADQDEMQRVMERMDELNAWGGMRPKRRKFWGCSIFTIWINKLNSFRWSKKKAGTGSPLPPGKGVLIPAFVSDVVEGRASATNIDHELAVVSACHATEIARSTSQPQRIDYV